MITTVRTDITWDGAAGKALSQTSEKKIKATIKDMTGAVGVEVIEVNSWDDESNEENE